MNTPDEREGLEPTKALTSELGDGDPNLRHELLFRRFLRSISIDPQQVIAKPMVPTTKAYLDGLWKLYGGHDHAKALGASFGLENMAIPMRDQPLPGLASLKRKRLRALDMEYFAFHRELESQHEDAMEEVSRVVGSDKSAEKSFETGIREALDLLHVFWMGLGKN